MKAGNKIRALNLINRFGAEVSEAIVDETISSLNKAEYGPRLEDSIVNIIADANEMRNEILNAKFGPAESKETKPGIMLMFGEIEFINDCAVVHHVHEVILVDSSCAKHIEEYAAERIKEYGWDWIAPQISKQKLIFI